MLTTPRKRAHAALLAAALIYSGYNVLLARALASLSPVAFSLCRELAAIPLGTRGLLTSKVGLDCRLQNTSGRDW